jgi:hypothetical protein
MTRPALTLQDLRVLLSISPAKPGPNEDAVAVRATWEQTFNSGDADQIATLYTKDAMMFGSTAQLFTGTDGVHTYFSKLPAGIRVVFGGGLLVPFARLAIVLRYNPTEIVEHAELFHGI